MFAEFIPSYILQPSPVMHLQVYQQSHMSSRTPPVKVNSVGSFHKSLQHRSTLHFEEIELTMHVQCYSDRQNDS